MDVEKSKHIYTMNMSENIPKQAPTPVPPVEKPHLKPEKTSRFNILHTIENLLFTAVIVATLLTLWTPNNLFSNNLLRQMLAEIDSEGSSTTILPTLTPSSRPRIGLVSGHWGYDSGAVCENGTTEVDVNLRIATLVRQYLIEAGYDVDLLKEFDENLYQYNAVALVSIHNDSCEYIDENATGFKVAAAVSNAYPEKSNKLTACLIDRYSADTGMSFHYNTITDDMTYYHAFNEINSNTIAAIIETGFLNLDYQMLTENTETVARGVADGILCYVRNEPITQTTPTP
ncbi:MAG: N-acetylmuramoyl-L-alanine amidase [Anaerolineaceae bacterium]